MFSNKNQEDTLKEVETIIGTSVKVEGNFVCHGSIVIDGEVVGNVKTDNFLEVGDTAKIIADVEAKDAKVSGEIKGNLIVTDYLELTKTAKITGDIKVGQISIEQGAVINGCLIMAANLVKKTIESKEDINK